ncbi:hypothetical protein ABKA04_004097 [Annulohypoxylon sp. FPYF3050]
MGSLLENHPIRLQDILRGKATASTAVRLLFYSPGSTEFYTEITYADLYTQALYRSQIIRQLSGFSVGRPVLLHLRSHRNAIVWFWSVLLAEGLPVQCPRLSNILEQSRAQLVHLNSLLEAPVCITSTEFLPFFDSAVHEAKLHVVEELESRLPLNVDSAAPSSLSSDSESAAVLFLTSGSTGPPKAVPLTHRQIIAAVEGKSQVRPRTPGGAFLNWVDLDHVASLVEIHIQALWLGVEQVHVHAADIVSSPRSLLDLLSRHRVTTSFTPSSFLAKLVRAIPAEDEQSWDLGSLSFLACGGEAVKLETCVAASELLSRYGAKPTVITPGFGMTETCAGAIFNTDCPAYDVAEGLAFASLGSCNSGIEMRVVISDSLKIHGCLGGVDTRVIADRGQPGYLQVRGPVVFSGYYRDPEATSMVFTPDGWFQTGDQAVLDERGRLHLVGRTKDVVNISGTKISTQDVQNSIERALNGLVNWVIGFPSRGPGADTEQVTVAYVPLSTMSTGDNAANHAAAADVYSRVVDTVICSTGSPPVVFDIPDESCLPLSALGKISRAQMRSLFEAGTFGKAVAAHRRKIESFYKMQNCNSQVPLDEIESSLLVDVAAVLTNLDAGGLDVHSLFFDLGCTSLDLIRLKSRIDERLKLKVPVILLAKNPTVSMLAVALRGLLSQQLSSNTVDTTNQQANLPPDLAILEGYDPIVTLRPAGHKTPLWLVHPGVGEVLVFVGLAQHLSADDRPVYALRAPGFDPGQQRFCSITEAVACYRTNMLRKQPCGPYAIAGYSYGGMLAFEIAKELEAEGHEVRLIAILNLPPHIRARVSRVSWALCLLHMSYFLGLCSEEHVDRVEADAGLCKRMRCMSRADAIEAVLGGCDSRTDRTARMAEIGHDAVSLAVYADVAYGLQRMAAEYEPRGDVGVLDVFYAMPLRAVARTREEWLHEKLAPWRHFCRSDVHFHPVGGAHNTMLHTEHVASFAETLKMVLRNRGL